MSRGRGSHGKAKKNKKDRRPRPSASQEDEVMEPEVMEPMLNESEGPSFDDVDPGLQETYRGFGELFSSVLPDGCLPNGARPYINVPPKAMETPSNGHQSDQKSPEKVHDEEDDGFLPPDLFHVEDFDEAGFTLLWMRAHGPRSYGRIKVEMAVEGASPRRVPYPTAPKWVRHVLEYGYQYDKRAIEVAIWHALLLWIMETRKRAEIKARVDAARFVQIKKDS